MNSPPVGFHTPPPVRPSRARYRPFRSKRQQVVPPDVLFAQGVARLAGCAAHSARSPDPPPEPSGDRQAGWMSHRSARARLLVGLRRLYRRAKPVLAPILDRIATTLQRILD